MLVDEHKPQWQVTKDGNPTMASRSYSQWQVERRSHGFHSWAYSLRNSSSTKRERLAIDLASHRWTWRWAWRQFLREQVSSSGRNFQPQHSRVGERERELTEPNPSRWSLKFNKLGRREQLSVCAAESIRFEHGLDRRFLAEMLGSSCPEQIWRENNKKGRCGSHSRPSSRHSRSSR